jgi:hypothetical protein
VLQACKWIDTELKDLSKFDDIVDTTEFVEQVEEHIMEEKRVATLDLTLEETPIRWWEIDKSTLHTWEDTIKVLQTHFLLDNGAPPTNTNSNLANLSLQFDGTLESRACSII